MGVPVSNQRWLASHMCSLSCSSAAEWGVGMGWGGVVVWIREGRGGPRGRTWTAHSKHDMPALGALISGRSAAVAPAPAERRCRRGCAPAGSRRRPAGARPLRCATSGCGLACAGWKPAGRWSAPAGGGGAWWRATGALSGAQGLLHAIGLRPHPACSQCAAGVQRHARAPATPSCTLHRSPSALCPTHDVVLGDVAAVLGPRVPPGVLRPLEDAQLLVGGLAHLVLPAGGMARPACASCCCSQCRGRLPAPCVRRRNLVLRGRAQATRHRCNSRAKRTTGQSGWGASR